MLAQHMFSLPPHEASLSQCRCGPAAPASAANPIVLREASILDLDVMVSIAVAAMPLDPQWDYRFPHRRSYPEDTWLFTRRRYREFLENNRRWWVVLAELVANPQGKPGSRVDHPKPIAFAIWDITHVTQGANSLKACSRQVGVAPPSTCPRRDASGKRLQAWSQTLRSSSRTLFEDRFGSDHFQLQILATHPGFQRLGAGTALCKEGIAMAQSLGKTITVFASPMGKRLYSRLGFQHLASVMVKAEGEEDSISVQAMAYLKGDEG
jgi:ribosomal protein S18 acetylase RimI-like enzyme